MKDLKDLNRKVSQLMWDGITGGWWGLVNIGLHFFFIFLTSYCSETEDFLVRSGIPKLTPKWLIVKINHF